VLTSQRHEVDADPAAFTAWATEIGWGDGLPLLPPTPERVQALVDAAGHDPGAVVGKLPPLGADCTVELVAVNAAMTGVMPTAMPLLVSAIEAMTEPDFELHALNATTAPVVPALIVNGPLRHRAKVAFGAGCLGGAESQSPAIGRALRLIMRNVAGQRIGSTSQSVFGQPGRVSGIVIGEWEERSPWQPFAERRGVVGDAVTVFGSMGTMNILDTKADSGRSLLQVMGRSLAYLGANGFYTGFPISEVVVAFNPVWADIVARSVPDINDVEAILAEHASLPASLWPAEHVRALADAGRITDDGRVHLLGEPDGHLHVIVAGGMGGLHGLALHGFGTSMAVTRPVPTT
jgi:hypothetical protein